MSYPEELLLELLRNPQCGDVIVKYKGGERRAIGEILKRRSDYFAAMLGGPMLEGQTQTISLEGISRNVLEIILYIFYIGKLPGPDYDVDCAKFMKAYCLFHEWNVESLMKLFKNPSFTWKSPHLALRYFLDRYPVTEQLCLDVINQIIRAYKAGENTEGRECIVEETDDLTRRVIVWSMAMGKITPEALKKIYDDYYREEEEDEKENDMSD